MNKIRIILKILLVFRALIIAGIIFVSVFFILFLQDGSMVNIGEPHWRIDSETMTNQIREILPSSSNSRFLDFRTDIEIPFNWQFRAFILFFLYLVTSYMLYIIHLVSRVIKGIETGNPFTLENTGRIKVLGLLLMISPLLEKIMNALFSNWIESQYQFEGLVLSYKNTLGWPIVLIGMIFYALGFAYDQGLRITKEQELTI